jgi:hypothetical protein
MPLPGRRMRPCAEPVADHVDAQRLVGFPHCCFVRADVDAMLGDPTAYMVVLQQEPLRRVDLNDPVLDFQVEVDGAASAIRA